MQEDPIVPLSPVINQDSDTFPSLAGLSPILPGFFIPPLTDKPQNPIMENLNLSPLNSLEAPMLSITRAQSTLSVNHSSSTRPLAPHIVWSSAAIHIRSLQNNVLSWDQLRPSHPTLSTSGPFLSEQDSMVFAAVNFHAQTRLAEPSVDVIYVSSDALIKALQITILGASSIYHTWDASLEKFVVSGSEPGRTGVIFVDGKDETISNSFISRFLVIGTSMRRLEILLNGLRTRSAEEGPTIHAFAHALSMVLSFLRDALALRSFGSPIQLEPTMLSSVWMRYQEYEEFLLEFACLYSREIEKLPSEYPSIDSSPVSLLSRIYNQLNIHLERQSPKLVLAILGYVLTATSHEYFQHVASATGFNAQISQQARPVLSGPIIQAPVDVWDDGEDGALKGYSNGGNQDETYPSFFPRELVEILPAAQKSLVLLRAAQPDHPLLLPPPSPRFINWFWTLAEIEQAWSEIPSHGIDRIVSSPEPLVAEAGASQLYKVELQEFRVFDMEPGLHVTQSQTVPGNAFNPIPKFIDAFPQLLPSIAPTLPHLTSLVFQPLLDHAALLSATLLSLFLSDTGPLNFKGHLRLLRSYLLLTSPHFKSRLSEALFSGSGDPHDEGAPGKSSLKPLHRKPERKVGSITQPWAVGLSPALLERETWPPVGADLSFFLRTVIVDSLELTKSVIEVNLGQRNIAEEAEYRLGFALRDLPTGSGKDNWLNPLAIEALDFLYMDYKPPHPVDVLITPEILSKYQRIFTFLLRLMRVQHALQSLFRLTRFSSTPLFPTLTSSQKLLIRFRFTAQSFVSALSEYIFDTAIGGNFDFFIARLSQQSPTDGMCHEFTDVFTLTESHSLLLDDILSACLLRSGQRSVGDLLRQALELVLELTIIIGELARGRMEEYEAAPAVEDSFRRFCAKMSTFAKVLRGLDGGNVISSVHSTSHPISSNNQQPTGGASALHHLLLRLDLGNWWCDAEYQPRQI